MRLCVYICMCMRPSPEPPAWAGRRLACQSWSARSGWCCVWSLASSTSGAHSWERTEGEDSKAVLWSQLSHTHHHHVETGRASVSTASSNAISVALSNTHWHQMCCDHCLMRCSARSCVLNHNPNPNPNNSISSYTLTPLTLSHVFYFSHISKNNPPHRQSKW